MMNKSILMKGTLAVVFSIFLACSNEPLEGTPTSTELTGAITLKGGVDSNTYYGPQVKLGQGHVRSWIRISHDGIPEELGIVMSKGLLEKLPPGVEPVQLVLPMHKKVGEVTPFDHVYFDWNPLGHEPEGVFTVPHFDVHFYMTSVAAREAIPIYDDAMAQFNNLPAAEYLPGDYFTPPFGGTAVPQMGSHWLPIALGDFLPFTNILLYGTYDGEVTFVEPMNTLAYLKSEVPFSMPFSQPAKFAKTSYYPTMYNVYQDKNGRNIISVSHFVKRTAS